jgi:hypothetical protein
MGPKAQEALEALGWRRSGLAGNDWAYANDPSGAVLSTDEVQSWVMRNINRCVHGWLTAHPHSAAREISTAFGYKHNAVTKILKAMKIAGRAEYKIRGGSSRWYAT